MPMGPVTPMEPAPELTGEFQPQPPPAPAGRSKVSTKMPEAGKGWLAAPTRELVRLVGPPVEAFTPPKEIVSACAGIEAKAATARHRPDRDFARTFMNTSEINRATKLCNTMYQKQG